MSKSLTEWIPAAAVVWLITSAVYVTGYFRYIGTKWMSALTLQDLVALSWSAVPASALSFAAGLLVNFILGGESLLASELVHEVDGKRKYRPLAYVWLTVAVVSPLMVMFLPDVVSPAGAVTIFVFGSLSWLGISAVLGSIISPQRRERDAPALIVLGATIWVYSFGISDSAALFAYPEADLVFLANGRVACTRILFMGQRGLLTGHIPKAGIEFIKDQDYHGIRRGQRCRVRDGKASSSPVPAKGRET